MKMPMLHAIAIDDEPLALDIIARFCRRSGNISLTVFSDPVLGLEAVRKERPDLVLLDIEMNGISGIEVARSLPEGKFVRIHRSFIIPVDRVSRYTSRSVILSCGKELPVGRVYSAAFRHSVAGCK